MKLTEMTTADEVAALTLNNLDLLITFLGDHGEPLSIPALDGARNLAAAAWNALAMEMELS